MNNWLTKLSQVEKTDDQLLQEKIEALPPDELQQIMWSLDPSARPTRMDAFESKIKEAEVVGRELAHEQPQQEKTAFLGTLLGGAGKLLAGQGIKSALGTVAKDAVVGGVSNQVSKALKPATTPAAASAAGGLAAGGGGFKYAGIPSGLLQRAGGYMVRHPGTALTAAGAVGGAIMAPRDQQTGQKQYLKGALVGGGLAAGANALTGGGIANTMRSAVMNPKSPILGQGVRGGLMDAAKATGKTPGSMYSPKVQGELTPRQAWHKGGRQGPEPGAMTGPTEGAVHVPETPAAAATPAPTSAPVATPAAAAAPAERAPMFGGYLQRHGVSPMSVAGQSAQVPQYAGGPVMGAVKTAYARLREKKAYVGIDDLAGGALGYHFGKKQHERGEEHNFGGKQVGSLLLPGGIGYQIGRYVGHEHGKNKDHEEKKKEAAQRIKEANRQTLTYDPATKTFTRQHLTPDTSMGSAGSDVIPAGHTEPVGRGQQFSEVRGQPVQPGLGPSGGLSQTHALQGGNVMSSSPGRGIAARPAAVPPPIPAAARMGGPMGMAGAAARMPRGLPSLAGAVSLAKKR